MATQTGTTLDLVKAGVDAVIKIQTRDGRLTYETIAPTIEHKEGYYKAVTITGFGDADVYMAGQPVVSDNKLRLFEVDYYPLKFAKAYEFDMEAKDDDVYNEVGDFAPDLAKAMRRRKNIEGANIFNNGFSSSYLIYDSQPLFSTAHPGVAGVTGANTPVTATAMGSVAVETVIGNLMGQLDPRGFSMEFEGEVEMHVGNLLFPLATRIVDAMGFAGTPDNDPNFVGRYVTVKRNDKITSPTAHFYKNKDQDEHGLRTIQFAPYKVFTQDEARTQQTLVVVTERYRMVALMWQGTWGDPGL